MLNFIKTFIQERGGLIEQIFGGGSSCALIHFPPAVICYSSCKTCILKHVKRCSNSQHYQNRECVVFFFLLPSVSQFFWNRLLKEIQKGDFINVGEGEVGRHSMFIMSYIFSARGNCAGHRVIDMRYYFWPSKRSCRIRPSMGRHNELSSWEQHRYMQCYIETALVILFMNVSIHFISNADLISIRKTLDVSNRYLFETDI